MDMWPLRRREQGIRQIGRGLGTLDREVFEAIAESPSPLLDAVDAPADLGRRPFQAVVCHRRRARGNQRPRAQRGATRGVLSLAVTSLFTNQVAKRIWRRPRPNSLSVPLRGAPGDRRRPTRCRRAIRPVRRPSRSASGWKARHWVWPWRCWRAWLGCPGSRPVRTTPVTCSPVSVSAPRIAVLGARVVPPVSIAKIPAADPLAVDTPARPDGAGVVLVINPASGGGTGARVLDEVREALPRGRDRRTRRGRRPRGGTACGGERAEVLAVGGGDGTVSCAAAVAVDAGIPLAVFPGGTFNHFAKDIGCDTVAKTVDAIRRGSVACVDLVCLNEAAHGGQHREHRRLPEVRADPGEDSSTGSASHWRASTRCFTRCAATSRCASPTTTRPCRLRCSSWAIRPICRRGSRRRGEPGSMTA